MGSFENQVRIFVDTVEKFEKAVWAFREAVEYIPSVIKVEAPQEEE